MAETLASLSILPSSRREFRTGHVIHVCPGGDITPAVYAMGHLRRPTTEHQRGPVRNAHTADSLPLRPEATDGP